MTTTTEVLKKAELHLVANVDSNGWAAGTLFLDNGDGVNELETKEYEYYQFHLSAGSLKKWVLNDDSQYTTSKGLDSLIIVNAEVHKDTDFACWLSNDESVNFIDVSYDADKKSLTLKDPNGPIDLINLRDMYYGNSKTDQNLC